MISVHPSFFNEFIICLLPAVSTDRHVVRKRSGQFADEFRDAPRSYQRIKQIRGSPYSPAGGGGAVPSFLASGVSLPKLPVSLRQCMMRLVNDNQSGAPLYSSRLRDNPLQCGIPAPFRIFRRTLFPRLSVLFWFSGYFSQFHTGLRFPLSVRRLPMRHNPHPACRYEYRRETLFTTAASRYLFPVPVGICTVSTPMELPLLKEPKLQSPAR